VIAGPLRSPRTGGTGFTSRGVPTGADDRSIITGGTGFGLTLRGNAGAADERSVITGDTGFGFTLRGIAGAADERSVITGGTGFGFALRGIAGAGDERSRALGGAAFATFGDAGANAAEPPGTCAEVAGARGFSWAGRAAPAAIAVDGRASSRARVRP
jgi:hypothetical protein